MRPFLLLSSRAEDEAADEEYEAFLRVTGLPPDRLRRVRMEAAPLPPFELDDYAGIFVGGGPFNSSDPPLAKSAVQHRVERELAALLDEVVAARLPVLRRLLRRRHARRAPGRRHRPHLRRADLAPSGCG